VHSSEKTLLVLPGLSDFEDFAARVCLLEELVYLAKEKSSERAVDII
jgi:hypothetical protein